MKRLTSALILSAAITGLGTTSLSMVSSAAQAAPGVELTCGGTVTTNAFLSHDLSCSGDGVTVVASGVTLDLRGHHLSGAGTGIGITVATNDTAPVTITHGTVSDFSSGIRAHASVTVRQLGVTRTNRGFDGHHGKWLSSAITSSTFVDNETAVLADSPEGKSLKISKTAFTRNNMGIRLRDVDGTSVTHCTFTDNVVGLITRQSDRHTITNSTFRNNDHPIILNQSGWNRVIKNRVLNNVNGLVLDGVQSQGNVIRQNRLEGNQTYGAKIGDPHSVVTGVEIADNRFLGNGAAGLWFLGGNEADGSSISRNVFRSNGSHPADLLDEHAAPLDDGLHVFNPASAGTVTLTDNVAVRNAGHGIEAEVVVDLGGNIERNNGAGSGFVQ